MYFEYDIGELAHNPFLLDAATFACAAHKGQVRKYGGDPYITHPIRVAKMVAEQIGATPEMVASAFLHDVVEDCEVSLSTIENKFGFTVAQYLVFLTNTADQLDLKRFGVNRKGRKRINHIVMSYAPPEAKVVKLCDRLDNVVDIIAHKDKVAQDYCNMYRDETKDLLEKIGMDNELSREVWKRLKQL